jgi:hypothetical protein
MTLTTHFIVSRLAMAAVVALIHVMSMVHFITMTSELAVVSTQSVMVAMSRGKTSTEHKDEPREKR